MKKLLSLLSVLTISGTAVPTTIAASPYQKEEITKEINNNLENNNYSWWDTIFALWEIGIKKTEETKDYLVGEFENIKNGLENLTINDLFTLFENREINDNNDNNITPELKVSYENIDEYFTDLDSVINFLQNRDNVRLINPETASVTERYFETYFINSYNNNNQYFIIPINIENSRRISLVFNSEDLYLQGFIGHPTSNNQTLNVYYYFRDATIRNISGVTSEVNMGFGSTYTDLRRGSNSEILISWENIINSFNQIALYGENPDHFNSNTNGINQIKINFIRVILATAEALRFREVRNNIIYNHHNNETGIWDRIFDSFLRNWDKFSKDALEYLILYGTLIGFAYINDISIFSRTLSNNFQSCSKGRSIDSNNNEYCFILPERKLYINNVEYGDYFQDSYFDKKRVFDLDINVTQAFQTLKIKDEQEFKKNFSTIFLQNYKSNYKAMTKNKWFYDFELNASEFKINDWSTKIISTVEDWAGAAYINGQIYSNYRLYKDKKNELHMQIEIWMQGSRSWTYSKMWIWLETGYFLNFNSSY